MPEEIEIEIKLPESFKKITPTKVFGLVLILCVILVAVFYFFSSKAPVNNAVDGDITRANMDTQVTIYVINDPDCIICTTSKVIMTLRGVLLNLKEVQIDYNSPEGKEIIERLGIIYVPAFIFGSSIENSVAFSQLKPFIVQRENAYILRVFGSKLIDRDEIPKKLDLFVMPTEENAMMFEPTVQEFIDEYNPDFGLYFVAKEEDDKIVSIFGKEDIEEATRQACAIKYEPDLFSFVFCRNKDMNETWAECSSNPKEMRECIEGEEGTLLLKENIQISNALGTEASPTLIINNQLIILGNQPYERIETVYCSVNPAECEE